MNALMPYIIACQTVIIPFKKVRGNEKNSVRLDIFAMCCYSYGIWQGDGLMLYLNKIANSLGGKAILGKAILSGNDLVALIHKGLPADSASYILKKGLLSKKEFNWLVTPERTFMRRLKDKKLSSEESDKLTRFIRIRSFAVEVLESEEEADAWLREKNIMLHNERPLDFLDTDSGSQLVEDLLGRIAHGIPS